MMMVDNHIISKSNSWAIKLSPVIGVYPNSYTLSMV